MSDADNLGMPAPSSQPDSPSVSRSGEPTQQAASPEPTPSPTSDPAAPLAVSPPANSPTEKTPGSQKFPKPLRFRPEHKPGAPPVLPEESAMGLRSRRKELDEEIEREMQEALGEVSDRDLYGDPSAGQKRAPTGTTSEKKKAKVLRVHAPDVFLDVPGGRAPGVLSLMQFPEGPPAIGSEWEITIEGYDSDNGLLILSRKGEAQQADWTSVTPGMIVEARVTATNKGGLTVDVNGIRGFMPISQIELFRVENIDAYVNQRLKCVVTEANPHERNLIVSRRDLLEREREEAREKLWQTLAEGQKHTGIVRSVKDFGAFVDLGGVDGLLHVSEMSWTRVKDASEVVQPGQSVQVVILKLDRERRKVSLGLKQLTASPWDNIEMRYSPGKVVAGKVSKLMDFGAFVELEPGVEGLIHISELAPQRVYRVSDVVQPGQEVQVLIVNVDASQRRISLSLKGALPKVEPTEAPELEEETEESIEVKPPRPRTTPLRGGLGG